MGRTDSEAVMLEVRGVVCVVIVTVCHVELSTKIYVEKPITFWNRQTREEYTEYIYIYLYICIKLIYIFL